MFLADGARGDIFHDKLAQGLLPNISRYIVEPGQAETILTVFPSTTGAAYLPYLTGCHPGTLNVPGIRWFDRDHYDRYGWSFKSFRSYVGLETYLMNRDIRPGTKTLFDLVDRPVNILNNIGRVKSSQDKTRFSRIWYLYYAHLTDHWSFVDQAMTKKVLKAIDEDFDFLFVVFPSVDEYAHRSSVVNPRVLKAYEEIDLQIGRIADKLKEKGMLDDTLFTIVSDHGLSDTQQHFDVGPYLEEKGVKTLFYTQIFKKNFSASSMISGNGMAHVYFKNPNSGGRRGWKERSYFEDLTMNGFWLDEFRLRPEIALTASLGRDGSIHLLTKKGHGLFRLQNNLIHYDWEHEEPLGLNLTKGHANSVKMTLDESLEMTWNSHFPDVFNQLHSLFKSPRCGDIILSAEKGSDLRKRYEHPEHKASHGAICPEHMKVPFLISSKLSQKIRRSVDVFPTVLQLLGKEIPAGIDGVSRV